jgi:TetR/AcrR family transcriptional repressor of nem operon
MSKGKQTRRKIVEAAAPIFNKRGYEGSSLNDLMEATGLKKGGMHRHFSSKEELAQKHFGGPHGAVSAISGHQES